MKTLLVGIALSLVALPASAQSSPESRWTPWLGCWDLVIENARDGAITPESARERPLPRSRDTIQPRVCITPDNDGGATFRTTVGSAPALVQTLVPDGKDRPVTEADCSGTQRAEWSRDALRLYTRAELTCKADAGARRVSGFAILGPNSTWTDVQSIEIGGRDSYRVRRYRRVDAPARDARAPGRSLTVDDVKEASGKVSPRAIEAALVETNASFPLTSRHVLDLDQAQVSPNVIDLMIALSYPKRFVVERTARVDRAPVPIIDDPFGLGWAFGYPMWVDGFGLYSPLYGSYSPYFYSPFSYGYLRGYNPYFGGGGFSVIDLGQGGPAQPRPSGNGRAVDGLGYTRVRPREPAPATASAQGGAVSGASSSGSSSSGSSGGGSVTSQGFSSGGSSGSSGGDGGGRTAQPR